MQMQLRPYQTESIQKIEEAQKDGVNKQVMVMATGLGKTVVFSHLISDFVKKTGKKALIIAHREELLNQAEDKLNKIDGDLITGIEQANLKVNGDTNVVIASVPTLGRTNSERINKFDPKEFCVVIIDEAHHASA
jgi:ATP-dependent helicase IRC3